MRKTGISEVGDIPWGTHFCNFYETKEDLLDTLVPYFEVGLEDNEFCVWVISDPLTEEAALHALRHNIPTLDRYLSKGSLEIFAARDWYLPGGVFESERAITGWNEKLNEALSRGYAGLRATGSATWVQRNDWEDFSEYERRLNQSIFGQSMTVLCTYPLATNGSGCLLDVASTHQFAIAKRKGKWEVVETPQLKRAREEIKTLNERLEQQVAERTRQLEAANEVLRKEIQEKANLHESLARSEAYLAEGQRISHTGSWAVSLPSNEVFWSQEMFRIYGLDPVTTKLSQQMAFQLIHFEDRPFVQEAFERAVREKRNYAVEHRAILADGTIKYLHALGHPVLNESGDIIEYVGTVVDITERKRAEGDLRAAEAKVAMVLNSITDRFFGLDKEWRYTYFNKHAEEQLTKLEKNPASLIGKVLWDEFQSPSVEDVLRRAMSERVAITHEHYYPPLQHWVENRVYPSPDGGLAIFQRYVTDRKEAEAALRESEEPYRLFVEGVKDYAIIMLDMEGRVTSWNKGAERIKGYRAEEIIGEHFSRFYTMKDIAQGKPEFDLKVAAQQGYYEYEAWRVRKDGTCFLANLVITPLIDERGRLRGFGKVTHDITERKRTEEALRASEERFRRYFELGLIGMAMTSPTQGILEVNDELCRILGYERTELLQKTWAEMTHPDDLAADVAQFNRVLAGEIDGYTLDKQWIRKDGRVINSIMAAHCVRRTDGSVDYFVGLVQDVSERKQAEEALRRSEAYLAEGQRLSHTGSGSWNVSTGEVFWSQETYRIYGFEPGSVTPSYEVFFKIVHPEDRLLVEQTFERVVREKIGYELEFRIIRPDGMMRYIYSVGTPVIDDSGTLTEVIGTVVDITARKQAEESLRKARTELEHVMRMTTMGGMAASIAHEVNQPLAAVVTNGHACLRWLAGESPNLDEAREAVNRIIRDGNRAGDVIQRIRALLKKTDIDKIRLDINEVIDEVITLVRSEVLSHGVSLRTDLAGTLPAVLGDRVELQQVILNLILNATKSMSAVMDRPRELLIRSQINESHGLVVTVRDTGVGLDPRHIARIFDAFFTTKSEGFGIGLWISRSIIDAHGGRIWAAANDGPGATFYFTLPSPLP